MTITIKIEQKSYIELVSIKVHKISKPKVYYTCNDAEYICPK